MSSYDDEVGERRARPPGGGVRLGPEPAPPDDTEPAPAAAHRADEGDGFEPFLNFDEARDDRDYVRLPRRGGWMRRVALSAGVAAIIGLVVVAGAAWWVLRQIDPPGGPGETVIVTVPEGANASQIAELLDREGVISSARIFREYIRWKGEGKVGSFQAGTYSLNRNSSLAEALAALKVGPVPGAYADVTIPEGVRVDSLAARLAEGVPWFSADEVNAALASVRSPYQPAEVATLEGLVFPDTYRFEESETEVEAVTKMVEQFNRVAAELNLDARAAELGYTPYEIVTIASMIEREARVPEERPMVARVIYNRMDEGMRLDIDATVQYPLRAEGRTLTSSDLGVDSPYNTRLYRGLPPTPIAAPGRASLEAALAPAEGDWIFYVLADADGRHFFTDSADEFEAAVEEAGRKGLL